MRDARIDTVAPVPLQEDMRRPSSKSMRAANELPPLAPPVRRGSSPFVSDMARLNAERAADADDLAAMLVRVADTERSRDVAEKRAAGLEAWTVDLEAKVAEARTRSDEMETQLIEMRSELSAARKAVERANARIVTLEGEVQAVRTEAATTIDSERAKHGAELEALRGQLKEAEAGKSAPTSRDSVARALAVLDELDKFESHTSASRARIFEQVRRAFEGEPGVALPPSRSAGDRATVAPPPGSAMPRGATNSDPPAPTKPPGRRSKAPPAPKLTVETRIDLSSLKDLKAVKVDE